MYSRRRTPFVYVSLASFRERAESLGGVVLRCDAETKK